MHTPILIFFLALIALSVMLGRKVVLMRKGVIVREQPVGNRIAHLEQHLVHMAKHYGRMLIVWILKGWVIVQSFARQKIRRIAKFIGILISKNEHRLVGEDQEKLSRIAQYQKKIVRLKEKIKEEEEDFFSK